MQSRSAELHAESKIHNNKVQRSKGLRLRFEERKFFEPYLHIYKRCKSTSTECNTGAI